MKDPKDKLIEAQSNYIDNLQTQLFRLIGATYHTDFTKELENKIEEAKKELQAANRKIPELTEQEHNEVNKLFESQSATATDQPPNPA